jgi:hypothetical protein
MDDNKTDVTKHGDRLFQQQLRRIVLRPLCRNIAFCMYWLVNGATGKDWGERGKAEGEETKTKPGEKEKPLHKKYAAKTQTRNNMKIS